jgi:hypothetical protein
MRKFVVFEIILIVIFFCSNCNRVTPPAQQKTGSDINAEALHNDELDEIRKSIKGETKIKVKKDAKGYSWEITGKDPQEVLKANDVLRKRLGD